MERMLANDRSVHVVFGQSGSGKSHFFDWLKQRSEYQNPRGWMRTVDDTRVQYFGKRVGIGTEVDERQMRSVYDLSTPWENSYAYRLLFQDAERVMLIEDVSTVLIEANLRMYVPHYDCLSEMLANVGNGLLIMERQRAEMRGMLAPNPPSQVHLRAIFVFCDSDTILRRRSGRPYADQDASLRAFARQVMQFQFPNFPFLAVDTSDESSEAEAKRMRDILDFLTAQVINESLILHRAEKAERRIWNMQRQIRAMNLF